MRPLLSNRFQQFELSDEEAQLAIRVSPLFLAYLQNKIADYANAVVEFQFDPAKESQTAALLKHEKLKAQVEILEELFQELNPAS